MYFGQIFSVTESFENIAEQLNKQQALPVRASKSNYKFAFISALRTKLQYFQLFLFIKSLTLAWQYRPEEMLLVPHFESMKN
jgi:hypothetical protein